MNTKLQIEHEYMALAVDLHFIILSLAVHAVSAHSHNGERSERTTTIDRLVRAHTYSTKFMNDKVKQCLLY